MVPLSPSTSWTQSTDFPSRLFDTGRDVYELYEEDNEYVLSVEMPGVDDEDIDVAWDDGLLHIAAERTEDAKSERRTYHRRFRSPKRVDDDAITAEYTNGILEVRLPVLEGATPQGKSIEVRG